MTGQQVYVIKSNGGPVKVGISANPLKRSRMLELGGPYSMSVVQVWDSEYAREVEKLAHGILLTKRLRGEWFEVSVDEAIAAIDQAIRSVVEYGRAAKFVYVRIPEDLKAWAQKQARAEGRSLANWLVRLVEQQKANDSQAKKARK